jgi:hypothetical protein
VAFEQHPEVARRGGVSRLVGLVVELDRSCLLSLLFVREREREQPVAIIGCGGVRDIAR